MDDEKVLITESTLDNIGEAIREKNGESNKYYPNQMPAAIRRIPTGSGSGSIVAVYPILISGEHIADIVVDGETFEIYAPDQIEYEAGAGIEITGDTIAVSQALRNTISGKVDSDTLATIVTNLTAAIADKQDILTAGQNITIIGNVISATGGGTTVIANPTGTPTEELSTIQIGEDIYEIVGGGGVVAEETVLYTNTGTSLGSFTLSDDYTNYDYLKIIVERNNSGEIIEIPVNHYKTDEIANSNALQVYGYGSEYASFSVPTTTPKTTFTYLGGSGILYIKKVIGLKYSSGGGGTDVEANPSEEPTEELNSIKIGDTVYEIVGGGGGGSGYTATLLHDCQGSPSLSQVTLSDSWKNYDALYIEGMFNGEAYFGNTKTRETLQQAADNNMYVGFLSFANTYIGLNRLSNDGVTLSFYGQNTNGVTRIFGLKYGSGGGGGASAVSDLTDVDLTNLADGQVLKWNATTQKWENANESGGTTLPFDVVINSNDNGIDIVYDDGT